MFELSVICIGCNLLPLWILQIIPQAMRAHVNGNLALFIADMWMAPLGVV